MASKKSARNENHKPTCDLNPIERLAVCKAKDLDLTEFERDDVLPGSYPVDCIVHVVGTLEVGNDAETHQTNRLKPFRLLAIALSKLNGITIERLVREADGVWDPKADEDPEEVKDIAKRAQQALDELRGKTKSVRKGAVKFDGILVRSKAPDGSVQVFEGDGLPKPGGIPA